MEKGQASVEIISILGISLLVVLVFSSLALRALSDMDSQKNYNAAQEAADSLAEAADYAYAQGEGAVRRVDIVLPENVDLSANVSYIGKPQNDTQDSDPKRININVGGTDVFALTSVPVSGALPRTFGPSVMKVVSQGSYVTIGQYVIDADRKAIFVSMAGGETRQASLKIYSVSDARATALLSKSWSYSDVGFAVSPTAFNATSNGTAISLTFNSSSLAHGTYNSLLSINATGTTTLANETIYVQVTVDVK